MAQYTPEPWTVNIGHPITVVAHRIGKPSPVIARFPDETETDRDVMPDAFLIAAAPTMFEAITLIASPNVSGKERQEIAQHALARAAIRRARGES